jgi:pimeloyl-ACP methyl ester carboxylesterase
MYGKTITTKDNQTLYYETHKGSPSKPTLFFVHGMGGDLDAWQFVIKPLQKEDYSTIAMDLRGHGYSTHPRTPESYNIEHLLQDIEDILDKEKQKEIILIGHCYGANIALMYTLQHPQRVSKLIVIGASYCPPPYLKHAILRKGAALATNIATLLSLPARKPWHSPYPAGKHHEDYEWFGLFRTIWHNSLRSYAQTSKQIENFDILKDLPKIKTPTLIIAGEKDSIYPLPLSEKLQEEIPNSRLEVIKNANHVMPMNNPKEVTKLIRNFCH